MRGRWVLTGNTRRQIVEPSERTEKNRKKTQLQAHANASGTAVYDWDGLVRSYNMAIKHPNGPRAFAKNRTSLRGSVFLFRSEEVCTDNEFYDPTTLSFRKSAGPVHGTAAEGKHTSHSLFPRFDYRNLPTSRQSPSSYVRSSPYGLFAHGDCLYTNA